PVYGRVPLKGDEKIKAGPEVPETGVFRLNLGRRRVLRRHPAPCNRLQFLQRNDNRLIVLEQRRTHRKSGARLRPGRNEFRNIVRFQESRANRLSSDLAWRAYPEETGSVSGDSNSAGISTSQGTYLPSASRSAGSNSGNLNS